MRQAGRTAGNSAAEQQDGIWAKRMASTVTARRSAGREVSCTALSRDGLSKGLNQLRNAECLRQGSSPQGWSFGEVQN